MKNLVILFLILAIATSCGGGKKETGSSGKITLAAAGATFPMPFYNLAFKKYGEEAGIHFRPAEALGE